MQKYPEYEANALRQIALWKSPGQSRLEKVMGVVNIPLDAAVDGVLRIPGLGQAIEKALAGTLGVINDVSQWTVRPDAILEEYRRFTSRHIAALSDIYALDLQTVDRVLGWLDTKYEGIALVEGAAAGGLSTLTPAAALAAIPADVIALMTLNLRAVGEYATYCGFDVSCQEERLFALNVLAYASSPTGSA